MPDDRLGAPNEKMRLCPSCRMSIPVLAVKCRFCGEEVGRPRDETRKLSITDLGGEDATMYAPSSNVMEALEAFRAEEIETVQQASTPKKKTLFGRAKQEEAPVRQARPGDLPELDENSKALASLAMPSRPRQSYRPPEPTWMKKIGVLGAFMAAVIILWFGGVKVAAIISDWRKPPAEAIKANIALQMLEEGRFDLAFEEAVSLNAQQPTEKNARILQEVREKATTRVRELLDAKNWDRSKLDEASQIMEKSVNDSDQATGKLHKEVNEDLAYYGMILKDVDVVGGKATFTLKKLGDTKDSECTGEKGGTIEGAARFKVLDVKADNTVSVEDSKRGRRVLVFKKGKRLEQALS